MLSTKRSKLFPAVAATANSAAATCPPDRCSGRAAEPSFLKKGQVEVGGSSPPPSHQLIRSVLRGLGGWAPRSVRRTSKIYSIRNLLGTASESWHIPAVLGKFVLDVFDITRKTSSAISFVGAFGTHFFYRKCLSSSLLCISAV